MLSPNALLAASWQGALLAVAVWLMLRVFPRLPARFRAALWWAASLKMMLVALAPASLRLAVRSMVETERRLDGPLPPLPAGHRFVLPHAPTPASPLVTPTALLELAWALGIAVLLLGFLRQAWRLCGVMRRSLPLPDGAIYDEAQRLASVLGLRRTPRLRVSGEIGTRWWFGLGGPSLYCPKDLRSRSHSRNSLSRWPTSWRTCGGMTSRWVSCPPSPKPFFGPTPWLGSPPGNGLPSGRQPAMPLPSPPRADRPLSTAGSSSRWPPPTADPPLPRPPRWARRRPTTRFAEESKT